MQRRVEISRKSMVNTIKIVLAASLSGNSSKANRARPLKSNGSVMEEQVIRKNGTSGTDFHKFTMI